MFIGLARGRVLLAIAVGVSIVGANVTAEVLKRIVLDRPDLVNGIGYLGNTYPSGHSTVAMSLAVGAVLVAPRRLRGTAAVAGIVYATAVSTAVLLTGAHRPSDAVAAAFVAVGWGAVVALYLVAFRGTGRDLPGYAAARIPARHVDPHRRGRARASWSPPARPPRSPTAPESTNCSSSKPAGR